jgi:hypothetical protein
MMGMREVFRAVAFIACVAFGLVAFYFSPKYRVRLWIGPSRPREYRLRKEERRREAYHRWRQAIPYWIACFACMVINALLS